MKMLQTSAITIFSKSPYKKKNLEVVLYIRNRMILKVKHVATRLNNCYCPRREQERQKFILQRQ